MSRSEQKEHEREKESEKGYWRQMEKERGKEEGENLTMFACVWMHKTFKSYCTHRTTDRANLHYSGNVWINRLFIDISQRRRRRGKTNSWGVHSLKIQLTESDCSTNKNTSQRTKERERGTTTRISRVDWVNNLIGQMLLLLLQDRDLNYLCSIDLQWIWK